MLLDENGIGWLDFHCFFNGFRQRGVQLQMNRFDVQEEARKNSSLTAATTRSLSIAKRCLVTYPDIPWKIIKCSWRHLALKAHQPRLERADRYPDRIPVYFSYPHHRCQFDSHIRWQSWLRWFPVECDHLTCAGELRGRSQIVDFHCHFCNSSIQSCTCCPCFLEGWWIQGMQENFWICRHGKKGDFYYGSMRWRRAPHSGDYMDDFVALKMLLGCETVVKQPFVASSVWKGKPGPRLITCLRSNDGRPPLSEHI